MRDLPLAIGIGTGVVTIALSVMLAESTDWGFPDGPISERANLIGMFVVALSCAVAAVRYLPWWYPLRLLGALVFGAVVLYGCLIATFAFSLLISGI